MSPEPGEIISRHLEPGESLLWAGQPRKGVRFQSADIFLVPFSLMWGGFAIFWEAMVLTMSHRHTKAIPLFFSLWGIPFVLVGLYLIFGRFLVDAFRRSNTYYGLTDRRAIIITGLFDRQPALDLSTLAGLVMGLGHAKVSSLDLRTMTDVSMTERGDGSGTITFGPQNPYTFLAGSGWPGLRYGYVTPRFKLIEQVMSVYMQIRAAQQKTP